MAARKRTETQIEQDRRKIARLLDRDIPQTEMARLLGVTQQQVSYDCQVLEKRWQDEARVSRSRVKARQLSKLSALEREYWAAWDASHDPWQTDEQPAEAWDGELALRRAQKAARGKQSSERTGNAAYAAGILNCITLRLKLYGLPMDVQKQDFSELEPDELKDIAEARGFHIVERSGAS